MAVRRVSHHEGPPAGSGAPESGPVWARVFGLMLLGGFSILVISLPGLADEDQQAGPGAWFYLVLAVIVAGLMSRTYVIVRRSSVPKHWALLIAFLAVPASYILAIALVFGLAVVVQ